MGLLRESFGPKGRKGKTPTPEGKENEQQEKIKVKT